MKELLLLLKKFFGYTSFSPLQADIIQRILQEEDSLGTDAHGWEESRSVFSYKLSICRVRL